MGAKSHRIVLVAMRNVIKFFSFYLFAAFAVMPLTCNAGQPNASTQESGSDDVNAVTILTASGVGVNGIKKEPHLIITQQRYKVNSKNENISVAELTSKTKLDLGAVLLSTSQEVFKIGNEYLALIVNIYEYTPPDQGYKLTSGHFHNLIGSYNFHEYVIKPK